MYSAETGHTIEDCATSGFPHPPELLHASAHHRDHATLVVIRRRDELGVG